MALEAASLAFSVAQTLLAILQSPEIRYLFSMWGYKSKLQDLEITVETVKSVLLSADSKQAQGHELSLQQLNYIRNLKDVVYEADDLIDEFVTTVALQQQHQSRRKVRKFISSIKKLGFGYEMSRKVRNIRKMLDRVADDANKFFIKIDDLPIRKREEMGYKVNVDGVVGRDGDKNEIIETLLDPNCGGEHVYVVTIVGMGGLGKTCLAQLVYNDPKIQKEFPLTLWVCVSDVDKNNFDIKSILVKILKSTGERHINELNLVQIADKLKKKLVKSSRYLLVLDDVWTESRNDWVKFMDYLSGLCQTGNKIVVTTRSEGTATAVGSNRIHKLKGLSDDHSWRLFEMAVGGARVNSTDFEDISRDIVKKCHNVPLALKVVGNLLYGQEKKIWLSFQNSKLTEVRKAGNDIMPILEFSYRSLSPSLKSCFTYCALFPKDFKFNKEKLLALWMAQGYVEPLDEGQNIEDAAEEYFQILARRCFFQDLENNQFQEAVSFKIHDLMHDMAQQVAGEEITTANSTTSTVWKRIRHVYDDSPRSRIQGCMVDAKIRTYLKGDIYHISQFPVSTLLAKWRSLRTLDMRDIGLSSLPDTIGQLLHLRYLDLSDNHELEMLPKSLTKLINLQYLNLDKCTKLKELPRDLSKLVNLRTLYVPEWLKQMPVCLARMTHLTRLNRFIVNYETKSGLKLEELRGLGNLKGSLDIVVYGKYERDKEYCGGGEYMCNTVAEHLNFILIEFWGGSNDEQVLEDLQPHSTNLKELRIISYSGVRMGGWAREDSLTTSLPNLVNIWLANCYELQELPWLGRLQHLKSLRLWCLWNVEYMENRSVGVGSSRDDGGVASNSSTLVESSIVLFFPSLEELHLVDMPKLKGWWMGEDEIVNPPAQTLPSFPRLSELNIERCPNLTSFPLCPCVETLDLYGVNERFEGIIKRGEMGVGSSSSSGKIREIRTDNLLYLNSLPMGAFQCLVMMKITRDNKLESLSEVEKVFRGCSSSLKSLKLEDCRKLRIVSEGGGLKYLTALEELTLLKLPELEFEETEEMPWRSLGQSLRSLQLRDLKKVDNLPKGMMRYLTALQSLEIKEVPLLKEIPEWIECLSSLQSLRIDDCQHLERLPTEMKNLTSLKEFALINCNEELYRRCEKPGGEYWAPILQHIPKLTITPYQQRKDNMSIAIGFLFKGEVGHMA